MLQRKKKGEMDDAALVREVASGNEAAFKELLSRYQHKILNFACRFLGDAEEAKDIAQETFLKFYRSAGNYRHSGRLESYMYTIARNLCIDHERKRRPEGSDRYQDPIEHHTPLDSLGRKESQEAFLSAVRGLPENQRSAILLRYSEELSNT
ncbi:MAG: sigma-70 family RNA polymerase sigma factor [Proteobacteria bacterium]|nr:sigma-70 family RNA polymerase sigma factor [Pseudomonadota bacterium]